MSLLAAALWVVIWLVLGVGAYVGLSLALLFALDFADDPPYAALEDLVFAVTLPFLAGVLAVSVARRS